MQGSPSAPVGCPVYTVLEADKELKVLIWLSKCAQARIQVGGLIGRTVGVYLWVWLEEFESSDKAKETQI